MWDFSGRPTVMKPFPNGRPLFTGALFGALIAGALMLLLHASMIHHVAMVPVLLSIMNYVAAGSLVARCTAR